MEHRHWTYEEFPAFEEQVEGAVTLPTTGREIGVSYQPDVVYATISQTPLRLQILTPFTREDRVEGDNTLFPCVVFVQGSAWMKQNVYFSLPLLARLAQRGYVVAVVEYRHCEIAPFPAQAVDTRNAVRFLRKNGAQYHIDPDQILLAGDSSGGHTAMFAGLIQDDQSQDNLFPGISAQVQGIIDYYGSCSVMRWDSNPSTLNHHLPDSPEGMEMGGVDLRQNPDLCRRLSVECQITPETQLPPVLIFHGTKDRIVNTYSSVDLYRKLRECGKPAWLYLLEGADHGGAEFWTEEILDIVDRFIRDCLS